MKYVIDEIKKIDSDAVIGAEITFNGKAYTCKTNKGRENQKANSKCVILENKKWKRFAKTRKLWDNKNNKREKGGDWEKIRCLKYRGFVTYVPSAIK